MSTLNNLSKTNNNFILLSLSNKYLFKTLVRTYSKAVPTCDPKDCPSPEIDNGKINPAVESITPSQSVDVVCNDGYVLSTVSPTITCETNKIFKPFNLPTCRGRCSIISHFQSN